MSEWGYDAWKLATPPEDDGPWYGWCEAHNRPAGPTGPCLTCIAEVRAGEALEP